MCLSQSQFSPAALWAPQSVNQEVLLIRRETITGEGIYFVFLVTVRCLFCPGGCPLSSAKAGRWRFHKSHCPKGGSPWEKVLPMAPASQQRRWDTWQPDFRYSARCRNELMFSVSSGSLLGTVPRVECKSWFWNSDFPGLPQHLTWGPVRRCSLCVGCSSVSCPTFEDQLLSPTTLYKVLLLLWDHIAFVWLTPRTNILCGTILSLPLPSPSKLKSLSEARQDLAM